MNEDDAFAVCVEYLHLVKKQLPGSLPSQRIAFKDLIAIYRNPTVEGNLLRTSKTQARDKLRYAKATGDGQSFRMLYSIKDRRPVDIYIDHRSSVYGTR